ncbi:MAG: DUF4386 domain-containing protein [Kaiparowitsia implicata GSE-PSE-MK54-09C]|nr:DUF4386 domain-containing protein [Kaiparowitsia implicata GSE-PSE-MK54-09C]
MTTETSTLNSNQNNKKRARIAGVLYLCVGIFGGFAQGFVAPKIYAAGDAGATTANVVANSGLVRLGVVADLANQVFFISLALVLYGLVKHVRPSVARAMLALVSIAVAIGSLNAVFLFEGLQVATGTSYLTAWGPAGINAMVMLLVEMNHYGLLIAQIFFGLWLAPLGILAYKSGLFPKALAGVLILGTICYLIDVLAAFLASDIGRMIHGYVVIPCAVAEISMVLHLLIVGVRNTTKPVPAVA